MLDTSGGSVKTGPLFFKITLDRLCINLIQWLKITEFVSITANNINEEEDKLES
jgi:hypothetical protein|tara:strand:- start:753 stop:914 length:162 start_codon:yes stop_codon:yes gene_type:complete